MSRLMYTGHVSNKPSSRVKQAVNQIKKNVGESTQYRFWFWQASFWLFLSVTSFFILTLWYGNLSLASIEHTVLQGIVGLGFSVLLYKVFELIWNKPLRYRMVVGGVVVFLIAFVWTIFRMYLLAWLTDFDSMFDEFGGWYFASLFIFLCWTGLFHGIRYYELQQEEHQSVLQAEAAARDEQIKRIEAQSIARDAQLKMLRYQLNPHFLSNTLNAINSLIELNEADKAQRMTVQLSQFLRYSLDNDPDTTIALKKEIDATNLYLEIEKTRFGDHLEINYEVAEEAEQALVPSLLLQPIIENSMKHAISKNEKGGKISIKARRENARLILVLSDTGDGSPTQKPTTQGVGLKNIQQRLKTLYDNDHELILTTEIGPGLTTIINLPFETLT